MNRKLVTVSVVTVVLSLILAGTPSVLAASRSQGGDTTPTTAVAVTPGTMPTAVIAAAQPYVHVVNYVATVDPAISRRLSSQAVAQVTKAVATYNALPMDARVQGLQSAPGGHLVPARQVQLLSGAAAHYSACREYAHLFFNWWGVTLYMNHCLVNDVAFAWGSIGIIAGMISAACAACAPFAWLLAGIAALYTGWLVWADNRCGGNGANVNAPWMWGWAPWISSVC